MATRGWHLNDAGVGETGVWRIKSPEESDSNGMCDRMLLCKIRAELGKPFYLGGKTTNPGLGDPTDRERNASERRAETKAGQGF